jgi:2'-5' RNA ligase
LDTEEIFKFREALRKKLDKSGIEYSKKFPEFKPHVTLSYHKEKVKDKKFDKISFEIDSVAIYGGDSGKEKIYVECKFGKNIKKKSCDYLLKKCEEFYKISNI